MWRGPGNVLGQLTRFYEGMATMGLLDVTRYAASLCAAAALLVGCAGRQAQAGFYVPAAGAAMATQVHGRSWILPEATSEDLLYVANTGSSSDVTVYAYPQGNLVGVLRGFNFPTGLCVDKVGDVFITSFYDETVVEYAHGGKSPIKTLTDNGAPYGCSIDRATGDLAVTNNCDGRIGSCYPSGTVLIYKHATGTPRKFTDKYSTEMLYCDYDKAGNLFVDGIEEFYQNGFAELPRGSTTFTSIALTLPQKVQQPGGLQWVGGYLTVAPGDGNAIYQYTVSGSRAELVHTTRLKGLRNSYGTNQFWIQGETAVAPVLSVSPKKHPFGSVEFFSYPAGGNARKTITKSIDYPEAAAISPVKM
jgi:hypothetical protein